MTPEKPDLDVLARLIGEMTPGELTVDLDCFDVENGIVACVTDKAVALLATIETNIVTVDLDREASKRAWARAKESQAYRDAKAIAALRNAAEWLIARARDAERYEKALRDIAGFELRGPAWEQLARDVVDDARAALKGETL